MEFKKYRCPVCNRQFADGDDVVVCPECGAPHHRECYEQENRCFFADRHADNFSFEELNEPREEETAPGGQNDAQSDFSDEAESQSQSDGEGEQQQSRNADGTGAQNGFPFGSMPFNMLDPLAGMDPDEKVADGIKVSEMAKYVGKNTPYFMIIFKRLFDTHRSRVNFSAFLFSGVYFIYRKMTKLGIIVALLNIALMVGSAAISLTPYYTECAAVFSGVMNNGYVIPADLQQSTDLLLKMLYLSLPNFLLNLQFIMMMLSGIFANRLYYKHCKKQIAAIKEKTEPSKLGDELEKSGGVNFPLAISFGVATIVIYLIILFF